VHIPDGYLGPQTYAVLDAAIVPIWLMAARKVKATLKSKQIPMMALGAAFAFVVMMFNVPVIGGSTGHAVGATLIAIVLGPWAACISISIALVVQALVFGDGGITAIGANVLNMAVIMPFVGYYLYRLVAGDAPRPFRRIAASGVASYVAIVAASIVAGTEFGLQPLLAHTASGQALYAPYPLSVAVPAMALEHTLFFGPLEALVTMGVVAALSRSDAGLLEMRPAARPLRWLWAGIGALILLAPIGALAQGTAWGEWSARQLQAMVGYVPAGMERLGGLWTSLMPGYAARGVSDPLVGYLLAAVVGTAAVVGLAWGLGALLTRRRPRADDAEDPGARRSTAAESVVDPRARTADPRVALLAARSATSGPRCGAGSAVARRRHGRSLARRTADSLSAAVTEVLLNDDAAGRPGLLQRLDPRVKLLSLVGLAVTASLVRSIPVLAVLVVATVALAVASRLDALSFARKVWGSAGVFAVLIAAPSATALVTRGPVLVPLGAISLTAPGVAGAITLVLRVVAGAGLALLVVWTTRWPDLLRGLAALGVPDVVVSTLAMTQKQIVSLLRTVEQVHLARESRTLTSGTPSDNRSWVTGRMAFLVRKSLRTADDVYDAMLARGFDGSVRAISRLTLRTRDAVWVASCGVACALVLLTDRMVMPR
jgi:cobalt/nickel transport system permease protein